MRHRAFHFAALIVALCSSAAAALPEPRDVLGFEPGTDYKLADYGQLLDYYRALDAASDRMTLVEIGESTQGRPMVVAFVSSEDNLRQLDRWRSISERLARAGSLDDAGARQLAHEGKAIVWIDAGLHSNEVATSQHMPRLAHHLLTDESDEVRRIRNDVVVMLMPMMNPDGHEVVVNWYRRQLGTPFETTQPPELYHQYVGHDINRDFYAILQQETRHLARVLYREWHPQIVLNHHQEAPFPARIHIPPFQDPLNPHVPALVTRGVNLIGTYMAQRFEEERKPGVLSRRTFEMWRADGMRYAPYYRNIVGLHTEVGHASATPRFVDPASLPQYFRPGASAMEVLSTREPSVFYANPWQGGWARLSDAVAYHLTASMAVLDIASLRREQWLYNRYTLGRDAIAAGVRGGPFAYVVPAGQWDAGEAVQMVNILRRGGVEVHRAAAPFTAGGQSYAAGSFIAFAGQAFRPVLGVLLEESQYPDRRLVPGGPIDPPRDLTGWTLPVQMGVRTDRIDAPFRAQVEEVRDNHPVRAGTVTGDARFGYLIAHRANASVLAINRLLRGGVPVSLARGDFGAGGRQHEAGTFVVRGGPELRTRLQALSDELGIDAVGIDVEPSAPLQALRLPRVGIYKSWVANMDEGWTRWLLERYEFPLDTLNDSQVRGGELANYDAIILPDQSADSILNGHAAGAMPPEYVGGMGTAGAAALRRFVERGGTLVALDEASTLAIQQFGLPVRESTAKLPEEEFYVPGSLIRLRVEPDHPIAYGMPRESAAFFVNSRAFEVLPRPHDAPSRSVDVAAYYADKDLLLSGLQVGAQRHLAGKPAVVRVRVERGNVVLVGFRPQFRAQSSATFKLLFNALHAAASERPRQPDAVSARGY
ncbi:MAG: M14 metallopeptidase family protein [Steroidobacteraceae bacterium]